MRDSTTRDNCPPGITTGPRPSQVHVTPDADRLRRVHWLWLSRSPLRLFCGLAPSIHFLSESIRVFTDLFVADAGYVRGKSPDESLLT